MNSLEHDEMSAEKRHGTGQRRLHILTSPFHRIKRLLALRTRTTHCVLTVVTFLNSGTNQLSNADLIQLINEQALSSFLLSADLSVLLPVRIVLVCANIKEFFCIVKRNFRQLRVMSGICFYTLFKIPQPFYPVSSLPLSSFMFLSFFRSLFFLSPTLSLLLCFDSEIMLRPSSTRHRTKSRKMYMPHAVFELSILMLTHSKIRFYQKGMGL